MLWNLIAGLSAGAVPHEHGRDLHRRLSEATGDAAGLSAEEVAEILRKEASNSYGIMALPGPEGTRKVRGSGLYPSASLINHDCLPNTARFDSFDAVPASGQPGDVCIAFKALHDIPAGEEVTTSYFPLTTSHSERQQRCSELYGFECACPRCQVEIAWSEEDTDAEDMEEGDNDTRQQPEEVAGTSSCGGIDAAYIQVFLLKYVCPLCSGTLAPIQGSDTYTCNMCGCTRTEADFMHELRVY